VKYIYSLILLLIPIGQHYTLQHNTPVWFCVPDELGWTRGNAVYLWGYYPMIHSKIGLMEFNDVIWETRYE
jgi:hypothetical protein